MKNLKCVLLLKNLLIHTGPHVLIRALHLLGSCYTEKGSLNGGETDADTERPKLIEFQDHYLSVLFRLCLTLPSADCFSSLEQDGLCGQAARTQPRFDSVKEDEAAS